MVCRGPFLERDNNRYIIRAKPVNENHAHRNKIARFWEWLTKPTTFGR
jgi:hypothetical protein